MRRWLLVFLATFLIAAFAAPNLNVSSQTDLELSVNHSVFFTAYSGGAIFETEMVLSNTIDEPMVAPSELQVGYPQETASLITFSNASVENTTLSVTTEVEGDITFFVVQLGDDMTIPGDGQLTVTLMIYAHSVLRNPRVDEYYALVPDHPVFRETVESLETIIEAPSGVDVDDFPDRFDLEGRTTLVMELEDLAPGETDVSNITFAERVSADAYLLYADVSRELQFEPDGSVHVTDRVDLNNRGSDSATRQIPIHYFYPSGASGFEVRSLLDLEIQNSVQEEDVSITLPFDIPGQGSYTVILEYDLLAEAELSGFFQRSTVYSLEFRNPLEMLIDTATISLKAPGGRVFSTESLTTLSPHIPEEGISESFDVEGQFAYSIFDVHKALFGPVSYVVVIGALVYAAYRLVPLRVMGTVSPETREYLRAARDELESLDDLLELEDRYSRKRIKRKAYLRRRTELYRELSELEKKLDSRRRKLEKGEEMKAADREILDRTKEVRDTFKELRHVEGEYSNRRLDFKEYRSKKGEIVKELRRKIDRLSAYMSAYSQ